MCPCVYEREKERRKRQRGKEMERKREIDQVMSRKVKSEEGSTERKDPNLIMILRSL